MKKASESRFPVCIGLVGILASASMFWTTAHGPGVSPDSTVYINTAKSLLAGKGFYSGGRAMTHYAPVYPLLLAAAGAFDKNILHASRLLDALFFGANAVLVAFAIYMYTQRSVTAAVCAVAWFLTSLAMLDLHSMAWSEPPFLGLSLATFILFSKYIANPRLGLLAWASILLGLAIATRYAGVTLLPPIIAGVLWSGNRPMRSRLRDSVIIGAIGCAPLAIWLLRNIAVAQTGTGRNFAVHPITGSHVMALVGTVHDVFLPIASSDWIKLLELGPPVALFIAAVRFSARGKVRGWREHDVATVSQLLNIVFCITYVAFLFVAVSWFDASTPVDSRLLSPVLVFLLLAVISLCWKAAKTTNRPFVWHGFLFFWFASVSTNAVQAIPLAARIRAEGRFYTSSIWTDSESIRFVRSLPVQMTLYTNGPDVIQFSTDREAVWIPEKVNAGTRIPNRDFEEGMKTMCRALAQPRAVLVYLRNINRWYLPREGEVQSACGLAVKARLADGTVYQKLNN
jgi:4-amino-4-deoxy-L-arabinose transferase-like glycosyltransferase